MARETSLAFPAGRSEARKIMEEDAGVKAKIFTAELFPYRVALMRK